MNGKDPYQLCVIVFWETKPSSKKKPNNPQNLEWWGGKKVFPWLRSMAGRWRQSKRKRLRRREMATEWGGGGVSHTEG